MRTTSGARFLGLYGWFERGIAGVILIGMIVVILLATYSFFLSLWSVFNRFDEPLDYTRFQSLFDRVLAAVISLELAHSIRQSVAGNHGLRQLRTVVVIGMLAVVRKLITVEVDQTTGVFLMGIASAVVALGGVLVAIQWVEGRRIDRGLSDPDDME
ncbi:phosphate-starvation-inducible PsiE family protein [Roseivivax roseus]